MRDIGDILVNIRTFVSHCKAEAPYDYYYSSQLLSENGDTLFYMNGNDGTDFDWKENGHLCEFMEFYKDTEYGYMKVIINNKDEMIGYVYGHDYKYGDEPFKAKQELQEGEAEKLMKFMYNNADFNDLYDKTLNEICENATRERR